MVEAIEQAQETGAEVPKVDGAHVGPRYDPLKALADKLRGEAKPAEVQDGETPPAEPGAAPKSKVKPETLEAAAEALGIGVEDLYKLKIPAKAQGAEPFTLGALKDLAAEQDQFKIRSLKFDETVRRREAELNRARAEVEMLLSAIPKETLNQELLGKVRGKIEERTRAERARTLEVIEEWADPATREQDLAGMVEHLADHGFPETALENIIDHRMFRYIRNNWLREKQIAEALAEIEEETPKPTPKSKGGQPKAKGPAKGGAPSTRTGRQVAGFMDTITQAATGNR